MNVNSVRYHPDWVCWKFPEEDERKKGLILNTTVIRKKRENLIQGGERGTLKRNRI